MRTITAANSVFALTVNGLYPVPQVLAGFATDDGFNSDDQDLAETVMGLDGHMSMGKIFSAVQMTITLMPDSSSIDIFSNWAAAMKGSREVLSASATIALPSIGYKYVCSNGVMTRGKPHPDVKKLLQAVNYRITWEDVQGMRTS